MDLKSTVMQLSDIERQALKAITGADKSFDEITSACGLNPDSVRRALQWLNQKQLIVLSSTQKTSYHADATQPLAERKMLDALNEPVMLSKLPLATGLDQKETGFCLGKLKKLNLVTIQGGLVSLTEVGKEFAQNKLAEEELIEKINDSGADQSFNEQEKESLKELVGRGIIKEKTTNEFSARLSEDGMQAQQLLAQVKQRQYNIFDPVPEIFGGKKHPYAKFVEEIKQKLVEMGFEEMPERLITQEFYNFDVLFQPQNHPARTWTDTYRLKSPQSGKLPDKKIVNAVKESHEHGAKTGSKGWSYKWSEEIAARLMPTAHGTSADSRQMVAGVKNPCKYFVVNRCYRPDVLDATHLVEFNQLDGFIVGQDLNFPKLLGILKQFAHEIAGATDVKFLPDYYPFTEPSVQLSAKHPKLGWIEFAGAGIFRPEVTQPLGIKEPVLAWGMGIDRLAMFRLGINDIRHLFSDDLQWLRNTKTVSE